MVSTEESFVEIKEMDAEKREPLSENVESEDKGTHAQEVERRAKLESPVTVSWALRSKSQEKPKAAEPNNTVKESNADGEKRRGRKKKQTNKSPVNEFSRTRTHLRYLLNRIRYEQNLIDAYSAEGWKGQSLEKLKPEKELQRAKSHILRYKLRIRELFRTLDLSLAAGKLPEYLFDPVGEIDSEDIFCSKCSSKDVLLNNDIILCDGACERGFHLFCLEPPLLKEEIPPDDEGWLCPGCDCKVDCIDMLEDFQGTNISLADSWEKIFPEAASGKKPDDAESSSDDSEDDDYDPNKPDKVEKVQGEESDESNYISVSDDLAACPNKEKNLGLPSDDSGDDDFDPTDANQDKQVNQDSSSSDFSSDSEDLGALLEDATTLGEDSGHISPEEENSGVGKEKRQSLKSELSYLMETNAQLLSGKRHVERLDYKKLLEETYGDSSSDSSDEDFHDTAAPKRRKINREKITVVSPNKTPITTKEMKKTRNLPKKDQKNLVDGVTNESSPEPGSASTVTKSSAKKAIGEAARQRLYEFFNENHYPDRDVRENLAKELGITVQKVTKWFGHARWSFNHKPGKGINITENQPEPQPDVEPQESNSVPGQNHIAESGAEI